MGAAHNEICPYGQVKSLRGENFSANVKCSLCERGQISFHIERSEIFHNVRENVISRFAMQNISLCSKQHKALMAP